MIDFDRYRAADLPPLSAEDAAKPYAPYYLRGRLSPPTRVAAAVRPHHPMDPALAVRPEDVAKTVAPGFPEPKTGYCLLPDGTPYGCVVTKMPGVTLDMVTWWIPWVLGDHMKYKVWHPGSHVEHYDGLAVEDLGDGMADVYLGESHSFADLGIPSDPGALAPEFLSLHSVKGRAQLHALPEDPTRGRFTLNSMVRAIPGGIEYWSIVWIGVHFAGGKPVRVLGAGERPTLENARHFAAHLAYEYFTFSRILPELYAQYKDEPVRTPAPWPERIGKKG